MDFRPATWEHIETVRQFMAKVENDIRHRADVHDQSKLVSPEVEIFDEFTPKLKTTTYGSDEYKSFLAAMAPALSHHYSVNSHHPEFYAYDREEKRIRTEWLVDGTAVRHMSLVDLLEMLCDWKAATMRHADGDIRKSIEINQKRFGYSDELKQILLNTLNLIEKE